MLEQIQLTPFDPKKSLRLVTDAASTEGAGFVFFQWSDELSPKEGAVIVNANCTRFKESQLLFSPIEAEAVALDFSISACNYWISYCPQVELYSDCSGLLDLLHKPLCDIENRRLQKILIRAQIYNFVPHHVPAERNEIADALSRLCGVVSRTEHSPEDNIRLLPMSKRAAIYKKELEIKDPLVESLAEAGGKDFDYINMLQDVENKTEFRFLPDDSELRLIKDSLPHLGIVQLDSGERLIVRNGTEVLIPKTERKNILKTLHLTHLATESMLLQTKSRIFWPGIRRDLEEYHKGCQECALYKNSKSQKKNEIDFSDLFEKFFLGTESKLTFVKRVMKTSW